MENQHPTKLSDGSLSLILEQRIEKLRPVVQILGTKIMANQKIRSVIFDGITMCQHCILVSDDLEDKFNRGLLDKFTVVRLEQYTVSSLPKKDNIPVILVNQLTIVKNGNEVGKKLSPNESIETMSSSSRNDEAMDITDDQFSMSSSTRAQSMSKDGIQENSKSIRKPEQNVSFRLENICPINVLTPFYNAWIIRALCLNKAPLRNYSNKRGDGKVFSFDLCDDSGEIRVTCFNDECDRFYDLIQKDKIYYVGKGNVKVANKKFSSVNNDYEITLNQSSFVKLCNDVQIEAPKMRYKFIPFSNILNMEAGTVIDIIGVIRSVSEIETILSKKNSKELFKREIVIVDKSLMEARLTLWNDQAKDFQGQPSQVLALKGAVIGDFKGKTITARDTTNIDIEPDLPETHLIRTWYRTLDPNENFMALSKSSDSSGIVNIRYIAQINPKKLSPGNTLIFTTNATIQAFNRIQNHLYKSCGFNNCQKKLSYMNNGLFHCSKCDRTSPTFTWRMMMNLLLSDVSGSFWVTAFQDQIEKMLNKSVNDLSQMFEEDQAQYTNVINELRFKNFNFRIYSRLDSYNNEMRIRHTVGQVFPVKSMDRARNLMRLIDILDNQIFA